MKLLNSATMILLATLLSCTGLHENDQAGIQGKDDSTKIKIERFVSEAWNKKNTAYLADKLTDNFVRTVNGIAVANNKTEMAPAMDVFFKGFPDLNLLLTNITANGMRSYTNWTLTGTNTGVFGEAPPTGKKVTVSGISVGTWDDNGKLSKEEVYFNELSMMQQLGYTLSPPAAK